MHTYPKYIHQTGPADKDYWHPVWFEGQEAWRKLYPSPEYTHYTWNDEEIDRLIENKFPYHWERYIQLPHHALRIDISRLFILYEYGGIYADLDYIPLRNFYDELKDDFSIVGGITYNEPVQNSLMCSTPHNISVLKLIDRIFADFFKYEVIHKNDLRWNDYIKLISGPLAISRHLTLFSKNVNILDPALYNPDHTVEHGPEIRGKHMLTGVWGQDILSLYDSKRDFLEQQMTWYRDNRGHDYTNHIPCDS